VVKGLVDDDDDDELRRSEGGGRSVELYSPMEFIGDFPVGLRGNTFTPEPLTKDSYPGEFATRGTAVGKGGGMVLIVDVDGIDVWTGLDEGDFVVDDEMLISDWAAAGGRRVVVVDRLVVNKVV